ncbi:Ig-like domain-containing protein, partial [Vibrio parahaemolyticus]|uniref:Ig-like domain-containing protein n=1 Tax=Vibrio parahaemolyticus TaxID=670 RepID=UPI001EEBA436
AVSPINPSIAKGLDQPFVAEVTYSDGSSRDVTIDPATNWRSDTTGVATVTTEGLAHGVETGPATITAVGTYDGVVLEDSTLLTVTAAEIASIEVTPNLTSIAKGRTQQFTAIATMTDDTPPLDITTDRGTSWVSTNTEYATISTSGADMGLASGDDVGTTTIQVTNAGITGSASLEVTNAELVSIDLEPDPLSIEEGTTSLLTALGTYTDTATDADRVDITLDMDGWTSVDTSTATVVDGTVTGVKFGSTTVTAMKDGVTSASSTINVTPTPIEFICGGAVDDTDQTNATGNCLKVATDADGNWFTSTPSIAVMDGLGYTVDNSDTNSGKTYASTYTEDGTYGPVDGVFAQFRQDGALAINPAEGGDGTDSQFDRWCQDLAAMEFAGKSSWRRPTRAELDGLYAANDNMWGARGWPAGTLYWSSTVYRSLYYYENLHNGFDGRGSPSNEHYASCVSNP